MEDGIYIHSLNKIQNITTTTQIYNLNILLYLFSYLVCIAIYNTKSTYIYNTIQFLWWWLLYLLDGVPPSTHIVSFYSFFVVFLFHWCNKKFIFIFISIIGRKVAQCYCTRGKRWGTDGMAIAGRKEKMEKLQEKITWNWKYKELR